MISFADARFVVRQSITTVAGVESADDEHMPLNQLGMAEDAVDTLKAAIELTLRLSVSLDLAATITLHSLMTVSDVVRTVQLSARKLCSNPNIPHEQPCCPYPSVCECGFRVK